MPEAKARNIALVLAAALLGVGAVINLVSGAQTFIDRPSIIEEGAVPAAVTYWGLSSLAFGAIQAVGALLLLQHRREGEVIAYVMAVLAAVYWIASITVRPFHSIVALAALGIMVILVGTNRASLT
jgi:hypothetical protein